MRTLALMATTVLAVAACAGPPTRERFNALFANNVGRGIDGDRYSSFCSVKRTEDLAGVQRLANGLDRYKFAVGPVGKVGPCTYYCDVDPRSRTVVAVKIDEVANDCRGSGWSRSPDGSIIR
jgi:hypothetical protein